MAPPLQPIHPKSERWEPTADPSHIVVPGLDTTASANDQIEQIEQLITMKLQNVDANFSKIQQVMANRILPAVKRYAVGTEPVREAAKFWTTFFEQAAQIRVPTYEDYNLPQDSEPEVERESLQETSTVEPSTQHTPDQLRTFDPDRTSSEVSFAPGQAAMSSTPARPKSQYDQDEPTPSWSASIESPLVRLDRELQNLTEDNEGPAASSSVAQQSRYEDDSQDITERQIDPPSFTDMTVQKGKANASREPLLRGVLRRNVDSSRNVAGVSPLKVKQKTPNLKSLNPYLPPDSKPSDWRGVVDLTDPRVLTPGRRGSPAKRHPGSQPSDAKRPSTPQFDDDDSFDIGLGMSPPITMDFARPPSSKTPKLGKTPKKQAAGRIMQNLVSTEVSGRSSSAKTTPLVFTRPGAAPSVESSIGSVPSPPSLTKYAHQFSSTADTSSSMADASIESMMRRVGLDVPGFGASHSQSKGKSDSLESYAAVPSSVFLPPSTSQTAVPQVEETPQMPPFDFSRVQVEDDLFGNANASMDSEDSFEEANNTAHPSAAFMMAVTSQHSNFDDDDSFDSNPNDTMGFGDDGTFATPPLFAHGMVMQEGDSFDDSFDDPVFDQPTDEETLFGVPPAQRLQAHAMYQNRMSSGGNLRMVGQDLLDDTLGISAHRTQAGRVEESPTPWSGVREQ